MKNNRSTSSPSTSADHRIYTDLPRLLRSRHWARDLKLFSRNAARSLLLGETHSRFRGRGMEFEEVRRYQPGDDIRTIDWRVSARTGKTYTKLFCEERERPVHILVDQRSSHFFGSSTQFKSVLAAELAAAIAWAALAGSDRIGGQIIGDLKESDIRAKRNKQAVLSFIHDLNEINHTLPNNADTKNLDNSITHSLEECQRITRPGTAIFIISDCHDFDQATAKALSTLGKHTDITLLQIIDPLETQLPMDGLVAISDGQRNTSVQFNSGLRKAYQQHKSKRDKQLNDALLNAKALYAQADTTQTARECLNSLFGRNRKRR